jgi:hypothetical protein
MVGLREVLANNKQAAYWFNMLSAVEKRGLSPILDQVFSTTDYYNGLFPGFSVWVTGSSLNLVDRYHNDVDIMVVVPGESIRKAKQMKLSQLWGLYKQMNDETIRAQVMDPIIIALGLGELMASIVDSLDYSEEIMSKDEAALGRRTNSPQEVNRILMDAQMEIQATRVKVDGMIDLEKNAHPTDDDQTHGYQYGPLVISFLKHVEKGLSKLRKMGQSQFTFDWQKSFSEGYEAGAGNNNAYIYSQERQAAPVHLFLTTKVDSQKAMEKKESFMLEYYTPQERLQPVRLI